MAPGTEPPVESGHDLVQSRLRVVALSAVSNAVVRSNVESSLAGFPDGGPS